MDAYRDRTLLTKFVVPALEATREFDVVALRHSSEIHSKSEAFDRAAAFLEIDGFEEKDVRDDYGDTPSDRTVEFTLVIAVRREDIDERDDEADRLCAVAANAINDLAMGGANYPALTRVRGGKWQPPQTPERRVSLRGRLVYEVTGWGEHNTDPDQ
jgi:hypothetical protein